jgi:Ca2+:H+ antiporter
MSTGPNRFSLYQRLVPGARSQSLNRKPSTATNLGSNAPSRSQTPLPRNYEPHSTPSQKQQVYSATNQGPPASPTMTRRVSYATAPAPSQTGYTPLIESVDHAVKNAGLQPMQLPESMTTDDFTRAVAVATVSALRHQQTQPHSPVRARASGVTVGGELEGGHGGHDAPSWSRTTSASVLLACTALYAAIAGKLFRIAFSALAHIYVQKSLSMWSMSFWKAPVSTRNSLVLLSSL